LIKIAIKYGFWHKVFNTPPNLRVKA
jgi:hypothetical protein